MPPLRNTWIDAVDREPIGFEALSVHESAATSRWHSELAIEAHRRNKAKCMGSLYWQLNDCWPGASWSSIDYYGKWKALHYKVKDAFAPVIVSHEFVDGDLLITIVSDRMDEFDGELEVVLSEFKDIEKIVRWNEVVKLEANSKKRVLAIPADQLSSGENQKYTYLQLFLYDRAGIVSKKNVYFLPFKELVLPRPELEFTVANDKSNLLYLTVTSKNFAKGVHVNCNSPYNFSDNFFDLPINGSKTITLTMDPDTDIDALIKSIEVRSLWSSMR